MSKLTKDEKVILSAAIATVCAGIFFILACLFTFIVLVGSI